MTGLQTMQKELDKLMEKQRQCINNFGYVKTSHRYKYNRLVQEASDLRKHIVFLANLLDG